MEAANLYQNESAIKDAAARLVMRPKGNWLIAPLEPDTPDAGADELLVPEDDEDEELLVLFGELALLLALELELPDGTLENVLMYDMFQYASS
jgi:hypothetical protein